MNLFDIAAGVGASAPQVFQNVGTLAGMQTEQDKLALARQQLEDARVESTKKLDILGRQADMEGEKLGFEREKLGLEKTKFADEAKMSALMREKGALEIAAAQRAEQQALENKKLKNLETDIINRYRAEGMVTGPKSEKLLLDTLHSVATDKEREFKAYSNDTGNELNKRMKEMQEHLILTDAADLSQEIEKTVNKIAKSKDKLEIRDLQVQEKELRAKHFSMVSRSTGLQKQKELETAAKKVEADALVHETSAFIAAAGGDVKKGIEDYKTFKIRERQVAHDNDPVIQAQKAANIKIRVDNLDKQFWAEGEMRYEELKTKLLDKEGKVLKGKALEKVIQADPSITKEAAKIVSEAEMIRFDPTAKGKFIGEKLNILLGKKRTDQWLNERTLLSNPTQGSGVPSPGVPVPTVTPQPPFSIEMDPYNKKSVEGFFKSKDATPFTIDMVYKQLPDARAKKIFDEVRAEVEKKPTATKSEISPVAAPQSLTEKIKSRAAASRVQANPLVPYKAMANTAVEKVKVATSGIKNRLQQASIEQRAAVMAGLGASDEEILKTLQKEYPNVKF